MAARQFLTVIEPGGAPSLKLLTESKLQLTGDPDTSYIVERSSYLKDWEPLPERLTTDAAGQATVSIAPGGAAAAVRFFRARLP